MVVVTSERPDPVGRSGRFPVPKQSSADWEIASMQLEQAWELGSAAHVPPQVCALVATADKQLTHADDTETPLWDKQDCKVDADVDEPMHVVISAS